MDDNKQGFHVYDDDGRDISSFSNPQNKGGFEDISSSSSAAAGGQDFVDFDSFSKNKQFSKNKHGAAGVTDKFTDWWRSKAVWKRVLMVFGITLFTLGCLLVIWKWFPFGIRGKLFCSAAGLLTLNIGSYLFIKWDKRVLQTFLMSFWSLLLALVLLITCTKTTWGYTINLLGYNYDYTFEDEDVAAKPVIDEKIMNIALFGIDTRSAESFTGNTDSIMILSLNTKENSIKIISIMRDTLVPIETDGGTVYHKINSAYTRGYNSKSVKNKSQTERWNMGAVYAVRTINQIFDLDIIDYATVNFFGMAKIIDAVGGIEVELTEREVTARGNNNHGINDMIAEVCGNMGLKAKDYYVTKSGKQHLNGVQAVAYSRIRYVPNIWGNNNDYGRTERQRFVMEQLFQKALTIDSSKYADLVFGLTDYFRTSLSPDKIVDLAVGILGKTPAFLKAQMPMDSSFCMASPKGSFGSVVYFDLELAGKMIHSFIYDNITFEDYLVNNDIDKSDYNDWYRKLSPGGSGSGGGSSTVTTPDDKPSTENDNDTDNDDDKDKPQEEDPETPPEEDPETPPETPEDPEDPENGGGDDDNTGDDDNSGGDNGGNGNDDNQGSDSPPDTESMPPATDEV